MDANYLQSMAHIAPAPSDQATPTVQTTSPGIRSQAGEMVSPEFLQKLQTFMVSMDERMSALETALEQPRQVQSSPQSQAITQTSATALQRRTQDDYQTPVPTAHQPRQNENVRAAIENVVAFTAILSLAVMAYIGFTRGESSQAERTNQNQHEQIERKDELIENLTEKASKSNCQAFCF